MNVTRIRTDDLETDQEMAMAIYQGIKPGKLTQIQEEMIKCVNLSILLTIIGMQVHEVRRLLLYMSHHRHR